MQEDIRMKNNNDIGRYSPCCVLGYRFVKWGLGFFIFGLIVGFGILIHYLVGSSYDNTNTFLTNITLWFGSPLTLSVSYLQLGGLAMAIIGAACLAVGKPYDTYARTSDTTRTTEGTVRTSDTTMSCPTGHKHTSLGLCNVGLIALFITGYIGYFIIDYIWPAFYYTPIPAGKNLWLILQGLSILIFLIGIILATSYICCCCCGSKKHKYNHNHKV